ncbi:hypothetical protein Taro_007018 [Colocasia esculenta]|uniref:Ornithine cyclodeaminase n=1 Tax=Colocasia esculenta TaxID=4460 RepID=A0A843TSV2_COLES|nr:hypothetical protein [Colocasia esculenta]
MASGSAAPAAASPAFLDASALRALLPNAALLGHLESALPAAAPAVRAPLRQSYPVDPAASASLLLMPAWSPSGTATALPYFGVKLVTSFPGNSARGLPGIHAAYVLFDSATGAVLASMDGTQLTLLRTAAISALATKFLAREGARVLVMVGAGELAPYLVRAHLLVRPSIRRVIIWNRTAGRARELAESLKGEAQLQGVDIGWTENLDGVVGMGDVVSCATSSMDPVVKGALLKPGAHLDLVGSFTPSMRECDDEALRRGRVFVDCEAALEEAGELVGVFQRGLMTAGDVAGSLLDLLGGAGGQKEAVFRRSEEEVTVFKSVGSAVVDLLAAQLVYETHSWGSG